MSFCQWTVWIQPEGAAAFRVSVFSRQEAALHAAENIARGISPSSHVVVVQESEIKVIKGSYI